MKAEEPEQKRSKVEFFGAPRNDIVWRMVGSLATDDEKRKVLQALVDDKKYHMSLQGHAYLSLLNSDDWRRKRDCHQKLGESYPLPQLATDSYIEAIDCCAKIPAQEVTSVDREKVAKIFSGLIKSVNEFSHTWSINIQSMQKFLDFYLKKFEFLNKERNKFLGLDGIELERMKEYLDKSRLDSSNSIKTRLLSAIIALFRKDATQPNSTLGSEIERLRVLGASNKDPDLQKAFDLFTLALTLTPSRQYQVLFRVPEPPRRVFNK